MAWRSDEHVVRGEIDNRTRGRVVGKIWFAGRAEPVELELRGDCWRDLAGRRLEFVNPDPQPKPGPAGNFATRQTGVVGDITASRKVKVPEVSMDELMKLYERRKPFPWHWGNSLSLEWFSERNGRVVIESASYELKIVGEPAWEMTAAEEDAQKRANAAARNGFLARLDEAVAQAHERAGAGGGSEAERQGEGKAGAPMTEAEADALQARSDLLIARIAVRMKREGDGADFERVMDEEMARLRRERGEPEPTRDDLTLREEWIAERWAFSRAAEADYNPAASAEFEAERNVNHPLVDEACGLYREWHRQAYAGQWVPKDALNEHPVQALLDATTIAVVRLAGVLNLRDWPPAIGFCARAIVRLKKVRERLDDALRALESCQEEQLIPPTQLGPMVVELSDLTSEVDGLIAELRAKLARGTE